VIRLTAIRRVAIAASAVVALGARAAEEAAPAVGSLLFVPSDVYNAAEAQAPQTVDAAMADASFAKASAAVEAGEGSIAVQHACAAVALDPNHADARRLLGYRQIGDHWAGGYAQQMLKSGHEWRPQFGWLKREHVARFEQRLRPFGARWISAEEDARRHASIERGWAVRTDHFLVTTNIDRAAGADLAVRLETLYQLWRQLFGELAEPPAELQARLDGKAPAGYRRQPFRVIYYRSRDEYNAALAPRQPQIDMTLGIYFDAQRQSHFFAGEDQDPGTIAHEAVHQFFYESTPRPTRNLAATANAWAVEGAACYFESLAPAGVRTFTIGTPDAGRLQAARHRRVVDDYYVPLADLSAMGVTDLQMRPDLPRLYSQSAGLASFFIDYEGGKYRGAFRELLQAIYAGRDAPDTLTVATGRSFEELDREYLQYMQSLPVTAVIAP
jgi:hypothetical protein